VTGDLLATHVAFSILALLLGLLLGTIVRIVVEAHR
jgi:hypothetical protein